jgi:uncharacterized protein (DUF1800 family)
MPIHLEVINPEAGLPHLLSRATFGVTPQLLERAGSIGWEAWVLEQLDPASIPDPTLEDALSNWTLNDTNDLKNYTLLHAVHSERQLLEVMTAFWDNHFNTDFPKHRQHAYELMENDAFRQNAFGYFRDLLDISAHSPAMLIYLDNYRSHKRAPNENYARELLELHTMGVDGGYTEEDVVDVARAFTGWAVQDGAYSFIPRRHDNDAKTILGVTIEGEDVDGKDGRAVLDILAGHPSTANFICLKLGRLFIDDNPPADVVGTCAQEFLASGGHIGSVVQHLLISDAIRRAGHYRSKVKTPFEFITSTIRGLDAKIGKRDMQNALTSLGMETFSNPVPTGWGETGDKWIGTSQYLGRIVLVNRLSLNQENPRITYISPGRLVQDLGLETPQSIADYLLHLMLGNDFTALEQSMARDTLNGDPANPFDLNAEDADQRLRQLIGLVLSLPSFSLQ